MNKQSFIERLNLHLDEELSPQESRELLAEIRENPEYHRIYIEYCKLFNACSQLGERFAEPKPRGQWQQKVYAIGGMAAAAALLLLAARNLTPMLTGFEGVSASTEGKAVGSTNKQAVEPLLVLDVNELNGKKVFLSDSSTLPFDLENAFDRNGKPHNFGTNSDVEFASYTVVPDRQSVSPWSNRQFTFGEAVETSTFEHEALSSSSAEEPRFSILAVGSSFDGSSQDVRYEYSRTAAMTATATAAKP